MLDKKYWQNRYQSNDTKWDTGAITPVLQSYIDQLTNKSIAILIPGCGNSYELEYLLQNHFTNTVAIDYAQAPIDNLKNRIPEKYHSQIIQEDFFAHQGEYDLILEQTFFCALDPNLRKRYVEKTHSLLAKNGKLVGVLFQFPLTNSGPPFGGSKQEYEALFANHFKINVLQTAYNSIKPRQENELFFIFTKK